MVSNGCRKSTPWLIFLRICNNCKMISNQVNSVFKFLIGILTKEPSTRGFTAFGVFITLSLLSASGRRERKEIKIFMWSCSTWNPWREKTEISQLTSKPGPASSELSGSSSIELIIKLLIRSEISFKQSKKLSWWFSTTTWFHWFPEELVVPCLHIYTSPNQLNNHTPF